MGNPWKGLDSYTEEDIKQQYSFCGRTHAIGRMYSIITDRLVSTLYGRTGCGKTSLLQAGVFPLLRQDFFLPVMCRVSLRRKDESFASYVISRIEDEMKNHGITSTVSEVSTDMLDSSEDYCLWKFMYGHKFKDNEGMEIFPVIILDQFEEVLINDAEDSALLLRQLDMLAGDFLTLPKDIYSNFRIVFSIREDYLFLLEDAIDEGGYPRLRDNRIRLTSMNNDEACEVIELGIDCFEKSDIENIKNVIINSSCDKRGHISTNMLSLYCSQCYELFVSKGHRLNENDLKQTGHSLLKDFYLSCMSHVSNKTREYIEEHLIANGHRNYVLMDQLLNHISDSDFETLSSGKYKILQVITTGESQGVELIHDTLAKIVHKLYTESTEMIRMQEEQKKKTEKVRQARKTFIPFGIELSMWAAFSCLCITQFVPSTTGSHFLLYVNLLTIAVNVLYSLASLGTSRFSRLHQVGILIFDYLVYLFYLVFQFDDWVLIFEYGSTSEVVCIFLSSVLYTLIPLCNFARTKDGTSKVSFLSTFRYVYRMEALSERPELKSFLTRYAMILLSISVGFLSLWHKCNWFLWVLFPICTVLSAWALMGKWREELYDFKKCGGILAFGGVTALIFTISQFCGFWAFYVAAIALFAIWALVIGIKQLKPNQNKWILNSMIIFFFCGLMLPHLFLGYVPSSNDHVNRSWSQPFVRLKEPNSIISYRGENEKMGIIAINSESKGVLFQPIFSSIDSVAYQLEGKYSDSIVVYSKSEIFDWSERFLSRGNSKMLKRRIDDLTENYEFDWTEETFEREAELAAAYRIIGMDSTALALEYDYFLRRMLVGEMRIVLYANSFFANAKSYGSLMDLYSHQMTDSTWERKYSQEAIALAQSNQKLANRAKSYLMSYKGTSSSELTFNLISQAKNASSYHDILLSYTYDTIPYSSLVQQLGNSDDMLFQTRHSIGTFVLDSVFNVAYSSKYCQNYGYLLNNAWYNIFLCKFDKAEEYAQASIEADSTQYITYTNLITSLWLQGKYEEAYAILSAKRENNIQTEDLDFRQILFPLQASGFHLTVGESVVQDFNHFKKIGIISTDSPEFANLGKMLATEFSTPSSNGHYCYGDGLMLSISDDTSKYVIYNSDGWHLPVMTDIEVNVTDSVAICQLESNGRYRFLDLHSWQFIGDEYDYAWHFSEGCAAVLTGEKIGFIDYDGNYVITPTFPTEEWLQNNHYKLAFHDNICSVMGNDHRYRLIDRNGDWFSERPWGYDLNFDYMKKTKDDGVIAYSNQKWYAADMNGDIIHSQNKNAELDDIIGEHAIYKHFDVTGLDSISKLPKNDISGIWTDTDNNNNIVYFGHNSSDFIWLNNNKVIHGRYYLDNNSNVIDYHDGISGSAFLNFVFDDNTGLSDIYDYSFTLHGRIGKIESLFGSETGEVVTLYKIRDLN